MKKLSIIFMAVMIAAIAGCAGDDSTDPNGDLAVVQQLVLDGTSTGRTVVLTWSAVTGDIEGYKIYFKTDGEGSWVEAGTSTTTTFTHNAVVAGTYAVMAYDGDNTSSDYSNTVSTMPMVFNNTYTIYDNNSAASAHSGFIFFDGTNYGVTGLAGDANFKQDMYAYDDSKGDVEVSLYSGNVGTFGNGYQCYFQTPASGVYGNCDPSGTWNGNSYPLYTSDSVVFVALPYSGGEYAYAKIYGLNITADTTPNGTIVSFSFEYQPEDLGLTLFTSNAN